MPVHRVTAGRSAGFAARARAVVRVGSPLFVSPFSFVIVPTGSGGGVAQRCPERASGRCGRNRRGTAGGLTPRAAANRHRRGSAGGDGIVRGRRRTGRRCWCRHAGPYLARSPVGTSVAGVRGCGPYLPRGSASGTDGFRFLPQRRPVPRIRVTTGIRRSPRWRSTVAADGHPCELGVAFGVGHRMTVASSRTGRQESQGPNELPPDPGEYLIGTSRINGRARSAHDRAHDRADLRDTASRDTASRDTASRDTASRDTASRDTDGFGAGTDLAPARTEPARATAVENTSVAADSTRQHDGPPERGRSSRRPSWLGATHPGPGQWRPEWHRSGMQRPEPAPPFPPHDVGAADLAALRAIVALAQAHGVPVASDPSLGHLDDGRTALLDLLDAHLAGGRGGRAVGSEHPDMHASGTGQPARPNDQPGTNPHPSPRRARYQDQGRGR